MIAGVGIDLVDVTRMRALLDEPGTTFAERVFSSAERATAAARPSGDPAMHLAARFAAKEACVKALSQALAPAPLPRAMADLRDIEVLVDEDGRPSLALAGTVRALAESARIVAIHLSLTHDGPSAAAVVVLERGSPSAAGIEHP